MFDAIVEGQITNLKNNYPKNPRTVIWRQKDLVIEFQDRGYGRAAFYVVCDHVPIAYCVGNIKTGNPDIFCITSTFVHPDYQRQGIGCILYTVIATLAFDLQSDWELSQGASALWVKLRGLYPDQIDLVDCTYLWKKPLDSVVNFAKTGE